MGDFTPLRRPGRYRVITDDGISSYPFDIGPSVFDAAYAPYSAPSTTSARSRKPMQNTPKAPGYMLTMPHLRRAEW